MTVCGTPFMSILTNPSPGSGFLKHHMIQLCPSQWLCTFGSVHHAQVQFDLSEDKGEGWLVFSNFMWERTEGSLWLLESPWGNLILVALSSEASSAVTWFLLLVCSAGCHHLQPRRWFKWRVLKFFLSLVPGPEYSKVILCLSSLLIKMWCGMLLYVSTILEVRAGYNPCYRLFHGKHVFFFLQTDTTWMLHECY